MQKASLTLLGVLFCAITFAQNVPQGINYQAVARDATGDELTNHPLDIKLSIISDISSGNISWQETHQDITNSYGLFTAIIGQGRSTSVGSSPTFDVVDWGASNHFLRVEIDYGSGYVDMGTTAFMSVPYALQAGNSDTREVQGASGIGFPEGGIIFWGGDINTIPEGFALCDGTQGTPDLSGKFIVGYGADSCLYPDPSKYGKWITDPGTISDKKRRYYILAYIMKL
jgi:hypothetical protein